jgi:hypothetical protein
VGYRILILGEQRSGSTALAVTIAKEIHAHYAGEFLLEGVTSSFNGYFAEDIVNQMRQIESSNPDRLGYVYLMHFNDFGLDAPRQLIPGEIPFFLRELLSHFTHILSIMRLSRLDKYLSELRLLSTGVAHQIASFEDAKFNLIPDTSNTDNLDSLDKESQASDWSKNVRLGPLDSNGIGAIANPSFEIQISDWVDRARLDALAVNIQIYWEERIQQIRRIEGGSDMLICRYEPIFGMTQSSEERRNEWVRIGNYLGLGIEANFEVPLRRVSADPFFSPEILKLFEESVCEFASFVPTEFVYKSARSDL